jgi:hypothetical protein
MIRVVHPGSRIRMLTFYPSRIPDPGVEKTPDSASGSATLIIRTNLSKYFKKGRLKQILKVINILQMHPHIRSNRELSWKVLWIRIRLFLVLPDPLVRGSDPDPDPSLPSSKNRKKSLDSYCFVTSL